MLMILARLVCSESFWAVVKVRSPHTGPGIRYIIATPLSERLHTAPPAVCNRLLGGVAAASGRHREVRNGANGQNQGFVTRAVPQ